MAGEALVAVELHGEPRRSWERSSGARERVPVIVGQLGVHCQRFPVQADVEGLRFLWESSRSSSSPLARLEWMPKNRPEREPDQSALNEYLGTRDSRPHQRSLQSLWSRATAAPPCALLSTRTLSGTMQASEDAQMQSQVKETRKSPALERTRLASSGRARSHRVPKSNDLMDRTTRSFHKGQSCSRLEQGQETRQRTTSSSRVASQKTQTRFPRLERERAALLTR